METIPPECGLGQCDHGSFPHSVVTIPARTVTRRPAPGRTGKVTETQPERSFVICQLCSHWAVPKTGCDCDCHAPRKEPA